MSAHEKGVQRLSAEETVIEIRRAVRAAFPGARISVRTDRARLCGVNVTWTDGPTTKQVREVVEPFESRRFDGIDDGYHPVPQVGPVRYTCWGVGIHRNDGAQGIAYAAEVMRAAGADVELATTSAGRLEVRGVVPAAIADELEVANTWGYRPQPARDVDASVAAAQIIARTDFTNLGAEERPTSSGE